MISRKSLKAKQNSGNQDESAPDVNRVKQRLRELYDFKTETEWPKRARNPSRETVWISKSSSEDDKSLQSQQSQQQKPERQSNSARRNSQDLEFNDRTTTNKSNKQQSNPKPRRKLPERPPLRRYSSGSDQVFEPINADDEKLRRFQDKLRLCEDLAKDNDEKVTFAKVTRVRERRTYSDDYENPNRRKLSDNVINSVLLENKRNSDSSVRSSRPSYAEIESTSSLARNSRTSSDASYVSIGSNTFYNPQIGKRGSIEFKSTSRRIEIQHRRTMSQYEPRSKNINQFDITQRSTNQFEPRPRTPVPPPEIEDIYKEFRGIGRTNGFQTRQRRNSTRYKVYLT